MCLMIKVGSSACKIRMVQDRMSRLSKRVLSHVTVAVNGPFDSIKLIHNGRNLFLQQTVMLSDVSGERETLGCF